MTWYHVEILTPGDSRTDTSTKSLDYARRRRDVVSKRSLVEVRTGAGDLVIDFMGQEERR